MQILILLSLFNFVFAAPELRSAKALKTELKVGTFSAQLAEGFHFNDKAPNGIQAENEFVKPTVFLPQNIKIEKLEGNALAGTAHLYVCDDKVTYCEMHSIAIGKSSLAKPKAPAISPKGKVDSHGFIINDFESALNKAQKENKMLLVDFGARWCPACLRIEDEIFDTPEFKSNTKNYVKAKIDIDVFASSVLKDKYNIRGVPTILFLTTEGKEIVRFYDYQPMDFINDVLAQVKMYPNSIEELEKKEQTTQTKEILAKRYFFSDQNTKALSLMENMKPQPKEYWFAKVSEGDALAKADPKNKKIQIQTLKNAINADPESSRSIVWRSSLADALGDDKKGNQKEITQLAKDSNELTKKLLKNEDDLVKAVQTDLLGEFTGLEGLYVALMNAATAETADLEQKAAWEAVITQGEKYKVNAKMPGASLRLLGAMIKAQSFEKALALVNSLLKEKPQDGDLQRRKMRVLVELKKFDEAILIGEKALKNSYGLNEFFVVEPLAKAYVSLNKKDQAKKLISKYLNRNEINFSDLKGIKGNLEKLNQQLL